MQVMPSTAVGTGIKVNMVVEGGSAFASKMVFPNSVIHAINGRVINETPHSDAVIMLSEPGARGCSDIALARVSRSTRPCTNPARATSRAPLGYFDGAGC